MVSVAFVSAVQEVAMATNPVASTNAKAAEKNVVDSSLFTVSPIKVL